MDLPKNIVQIGKPDKLHKIFVEDYVISYIKQVNRTSQGQLKGIAFYGQKYVEENVRYYFLYGASVVPGLEGRGQYLSELERESIEQVQQEFFESYQFLAWCSLNGELPDGFYLMEQGKGLRIDGYATFFEKNDCMLNFLVTSGNQEREGVHTSPEKEEQPASKQDKAFSQRGSGWEAGRLTAGGDLEHRLSERSKKLEAARGLSKKQVSVKYTEKKPIKWRTVWVGAVVLLCVIGIATLGDEEKRKELQVAARQVIESLSEQKLPDQEREGLKESVPIVEDTNSEPKASPESASLPDASTQESTQTPESTGESVAPSTEPSAEPSIEPSQEPEEQEPVQTVTYVIQKGDTLLELCRERYGSEAIMQEICELNGIENADHIKIGQIILLPK